MRPEQLQEGVLCELAVTKWMAIIKMDPKKANGLPKEIVRLRQDLLDDRSIIKEIESIKRSAQNFIKDNSMPFPIDGIFWVPKHKIEEIDAYLEEAKKEFYATVENLISEKSKLQKEFARKYPSFYDPKKYPTADQLRGKHSFEWRFFQFTLPDKDTSILPASLYKKEKEKFDNIAKEMNEIAINVIGNKLLERIETLKGQCEGDSINSGTVNSINKLLEKWNDIWKDNVSNEKLESVIKSLRVQMARTSSDRLKSNEDFRNKAEKKFETIASQIKKIPNFELKRKLDV